MSPYPTVVIVTMAQYSDRTYWVIESASLIPDMTAQLFAGKFSTNGTRNQVQAIQWMISIMMAKNFVMRREPEFVQLRSCQRRKIARSRTTRKSRNTRKIRIKEIP